tara:strand:+ start:1547 stop:2338 length:792 start_codon:yes stop_codon:yes gene_type:complete
MIVQQDFLNKLRDFGLNSYESKLWAALLSRGISTAGELSDIANVPRSRTYDVLESLEKKGFIIMKLGKPIKYIAVPPSEVLERVKRKVEEDAQKKAEMLDNIKDDNILKELNLLHKNGIDLVEPTELSGFIKGVDNLYNHFEFIIKNATDSIDILTTAPGLQKKSEKLIPLLKEASERGITIRIISPVKKTDETTKAFKNIAEIKTADDVTGRLFLVDKKHVTFMLLNNEQIHDSYDTAIWVNTEFFSTTMTNLFEKTWKASK